MADDVDAAASALSCETADEHGLQRLAKRSRDFAPALAEMRGTAVDREILSHLMEENAVGSDGESSTCELSLGSGNSEGEDERLQEDAEVFTGLNSYRRYAVTRG